MIWEIMRPENLLFVLVDYQENFLPLFKAKHQEVVKKNILLMVKMFTELKIPMIGTDHYRNGLGATDKNVLDVWSGETFKDKITFSCCKNDEFKADFTKNERDIVVVCGLETHICVLQTVLDLLKMGKKVIVIKDACLSSTTLRWENGLELAKDAGAHIMNAESVIFYLLQRADSPEFKYLVKLLKDAQ